jgi:hypothetical protein
MHWTAREYTAVFGALSSSVCKRIQVRRRDTCTSCKFVQLASLSTVRMTMLLERRRLEAMPRVSLKGVVFMIASKRMCMSGTFT